MVTTTSKGTAVVTLPSDTQVLITREFNAPRHLVFRAYTTPEYIRRWWAGERGTVTSAEVDLRVGGAWRYVMTAHGGFEVAFHGEFEQIVPDERLVFTEIYEALPDAKVLVTVELVEQDGRTTLRMLVDHDNQQARDMHLNSGMEVGMQEGMDILEKIAVSLG